MDARRTLKCLLVAALLSGASGCVESEVGSAEDHLEGTVVDAADAKRRKGMARIEALYAKAELDDFSRGHLPSDHRRHAIAVQCGYGGHVLPKQWNLAGKTDMSSGSLEREELGLSPFNPRLYYHQVPMWVLRSGGDGYNAADRVFIMDQVGTLLHSGVVLRGPGTEATLTWDDELPERADLDCERYGKLRIGDDTEPRIVDTTE